MSPKKLFIVQYSHELDQFQLQEIDEPKSKYGFDIPIIDASNDSIISLSSYQVDTDKIECSFPDAQVFHNPHNKVIKPYNYGLLYNAFAIHHPNFVPEGWHIPSNEEWETLKATVAESGGNLKEPGLEYWQEPNTGSPNNFNFNARGAGYRKRSDRYYDLQLHAYFWSSDIYSESWTYRYKLNYNDTELNRLFTTDDQGLSVRLIKDDNNDQGTLNDIDGNEYKTITIGNQVWLARNWQCTKLNDGTPIDNITGYHDWEQNPIPSYWAYNDDFTLV